MTLTRSAPQRRRLFFLGLVIRLVGVALLWAGDGASSLFRKVLVVVGLVLMVGGIGVLRYLLLADPVSRVIARFRGP